ncbi:uncharacterized protein LOC132166792 [Corylus avellana]|uniref:uncharacterized protein LOC132166792 n=1 Tax=Corylus avellana TaxID=13451 RepID=UPI001E227AC6|nr:uncharacterized protein LOC132166792 [Corylus avellana]
MASTMIKVATCVDSGSDMPETCLSDEPSGSLASAVEATVGSAKVAPSDFGSLGSSALVPVAKERETATVKADRKPPLAKGFLRREFFGPCSASSPSLPSSEVKVVSSEAVLSESKSAKIGENVEVGECNSAKIGENVEVGECKSARFGENGEVGLESYSEVVLNAMEIAPSLGLSFGGDEKRLMDLLLAIERDRNMEDGVSVSKSMEKEVVQKFEMFHSS